MKHLTLHRIASLLHRFCCPALVKTERRYICYCFVMLSCSGQPPPPPQHFRMFVVGGGEATFGNFGSTTWLDPGLSEQKWAPTCLCPAQAVVPASFDREIAWWDPGRATHTTAALLNERREEKLTVTWRRGIGQWQHRLAGKIWTNLYGQCWGSSRDCRRGHLPRGSWWACRPPHSVHGIVGGGGPANTALPFPPSFLQKQ